MGPKPAAEFVELVATADIGLNLRRPPTNGETSSSLLDLLRQGIPTLITDVGTFADFPEHAVRKLPWRDDRDQAMLTKTLVELATNALERTQLGESALKYVRDRHDWSQVALRYVEAIEASRRDLRQDALPPVGRPHIRFERTRNSFIARQQG
jgi:glycosyltransferase involved in cell wall biosynthesis